MGSAERCAGTPNEHDENVGLHAVGVQKHDFQDHVPGRIRTSGFSEHHVTINLLPQRDDLTTNRQGHLWRWMHMFHASESTL